MIEQLIQDKQILIAEKESLQTKLHELKNPKSDHCDNSSDLIKEVYKGLYPHEENCLNAREMMLCIQSEIESLR